MFNKEDKIWKHQTAEPILQDRMPQQLHCPKLGIAAVLFANCLLRGPLGIAT